MINLKIKLPYANNQGFSLLELTIALAIIGIIFTFTVNLFSKQREKAELAIAESMLNKYAQELIVFQLKTGKIPDNENEFQTFIN